MRRQLWEEAAEEADAEAPEAPEQRDPAAA